MATDIFTGLANPVDIFTGVANPVDIFTGLADVETPNFISDEYLIESFTFTGLHIFIVYTGRYYLILN